MLLKKFDGNSSQQICLYGSTRIFENHYTNEINILNTMKWINKIIWKPLDTKVHL